MKILNIIFIISTIYILFSVNAFSLAVTDKSAKLKNTQPNTLKSTKPSKLKNTKPNTLKSTKPNKLKSTTPNKLKSTTPNKLKSTTPNKLKNTKPKKLKNTQPNTLKNTKPKITKSQNINPVSIKNINILNPSFSTPSYYKKLQIKKNQQKNQKIISRLESLEDNSNSSLFILSKAYGSTKDYKNQMRILKKLVRRDKKNGYYLLDLAKSFRNTYFKTHLLKYKNLAIETINKVYLLPKKYQELAHLEMLTLLKYVNTKDSKETILQLIDTLIKDFGVKKEYVTEYCKYLYLNQYYKYSLSYCKKAIKNYPKEPINYIYYTLSKTDNKRVLFKNIAKKFPNSDFVQLQTALFFTGQEEYKKALPYFKKTIQINPQSLKGQLGTAQSLFYTNKERLSYKYFLKACMMDTHSMLYEFKKAKSILIRKNKIKLATVFEKGITKCFFTQ